LRKILLSTLMKALLPTDKEAPKVAAKKGAKTKKGDKAAAAAAATAPVQEEAAAKPTPAAAATEAVADASAVKASAPAPSVDPPATGRASPPSVAPPPEVQKKEVKEEVHVTHEEAPMLSTEGTFFACNTVILLQSLR
jgi:hypothetical protein